MELLSRVIDLLSGKIDLSTDLYQAYYEIVFFSRGIYFSLFDNAWNIDHFTCLKSQVVVGILPPESGLGLTAPHEWVWSNFFRQETPFTITWFTTPSLSRFFVHTYITKSPRLGDLETRQTRVSYSAMWGRFKYCMHDQQRTESSPQISSFSWINAVGWTFCM